MISCQEIIRRDNTWRYTYLHTICHTKKNTKDVKSEKVLRDINYLNQFP